LLLLSNAPMFGDKHIIGLGVIAVVIVILLLGVKKTDYQKQKSQILLFMILFFALEIAKLAYIINESGSFPMHQLPFHLCSLPLYLYPIMYISKENSKLQNFVKPAAFGVVLLAAVAALALPSTIIGDQLSWLPLGLNILPIISFTYHGLMIYSAFYLIKSGFYKFSIKGYKYAIMTVVPLLIPALFFNYIWDKDYMCLNRGSGIPFNFLRDTSQALFTGTLIGVAFLIIFIVFFITELILKTVPNEKKRKNYS